MAPPPDWNPWDRQDGEPDLGWALFQQFLTLAAPRDVRTLAKHPGGRYRLDELQRIAFEWYWNDRARLWDEHLDHIRRDTIERVTEETAADVARRQLRLMAKMQRLAEKEIDKLVTMTEANDAPGTITPRDAIRLAGVSVRLERLIRGESTEKIETGPDLSRLSAEELRAVREIQDRAGIR